MTLNNNLPNMKGTNMEYNITATDIANAAHPQSLTPLADIADLREKIAELQIERNKVAAELDALRGGHRRLITSLQQDLEGFAESYLQSGDEDYRELSELMVNNGLDGLKRTFKVTVSVRYDFEVEVEATDEDEARDEVDNNLYTYAQDYVELSSPDDYDIEATEA